MSMYCKSQLVRDLRLILDWRGESQSLGMFMSRLYSDNTITVEDRFVVDPTLSDQFGKRLALDAVPTESDVGIHVLRLAIGIEELGP